MEKLTVHFVKELCYTLIISIFSFLIFIHFTKQITSKQSLAQKWNLILSINPNKLADKYFTFDMHGHKGWRMDGTTFTRCYTLLSNAEMNLMPILFCYISHGTGQ